MERMNVDFASKTVELAEHESYLELVNRICYFGEPNGNGVALDYSDPDEALRMAQTLVDMPVVAKYVINEEGEDDLGGHEAYLDSAGDLNFGTSAIGTHTEVYIEEAEVPLFSGETRTLPCLFAKQRVWTRFKNVTSAIKRLFAEGNLHNSWELSSNKYTYEDGIKRLVDYEFLGNAFLGSGVTAAYKDASKVLSLSELMVAEALALDIRENAGEEEEKMEPNVPVEIAEPVEASVEEKVVEEQVVEESSVEEVAEVEEVETASLTVEDLYEKLTKAILDKIGRGCWGFIAFLFPEEHVCWFKRYDCGDSQLDYHLFNYTVENDEVTVDNGQLVTLVVSVAEMNSKIEELSEAVAAANSSIKSLSDAVSALEPYRVAHEEAEAARKKAEHEAAVAALRQYVVDSGRFTEEEMASAEMTTLIESLDKVSINTMIAERFVAHVRCANVEISELNEFVESAESIKLNLQVDEVNENPVNDFRSFLWS